MAKQIKDVTFSGTDALVLLADASDLAGSGANPLFEGVFFEDRLAPHHDDRAVAILSEFHPELTTLDSEGVTGLSEKPSMDLMFRAHNQIALFYRNPDTPT